MAHSQVDKVYYTMSIIHGTLWLEIVNFYNISRLRDRSLHPCARDAVCINLRCTSKAR